jgi:hypothetical protein
MNVRRQPPFFILNCLALQGLAAALAEVYINLTGEKKNVGQLAYVPSYESYN